MKKTWLIIYLFTIIICISGCNLITVPANEIEIISIEETNFTTKEIFQEKIFDQCESESNLIAQIQFSDNYSQQEGEEIVISGIFAGGISVAKIVEIELEGAIEKHYSSNVSSSQGHEESVTIEVLANTMQRNILIWEELRSEGVIVYLENGEEKEIAYSYRIGLELKSTKSEKLECELSGNSSTERPTNTANPLPSSTPKSLITGPLYEIGEWHEEDGVAIRLLDYSFGGGNIYFTLEVWNKTDNDYFISYSPDSNTFVIDNLNRRHTSTFYTSKEIHLTPQGRGEIIVAPINAYTTRFRDDFLYDSGVTDIYLLIEDILMFEKVFWHINLNN